MANRDQVALGMSRGTNGRRARALMAVGISLVLTLTACADNDETPDSAGETAGGAPQDTAQPDASTETADDQSEPDDAADAEPDEGAAEALEPLDDGFPERAITLWSVQDPGHTDDLFNQIVADIARQYSPVDINVDVNPSGPPYAYAHMEFLKPQPGGEEGYHPFSLSWFGGTLRPYLVPALETVDPEGIQPVNSMVEAPFMIVANLESDFDTLEDAEQFAQDNPGELLTVASTAGSATHGALLVWAESAGIEIDFLPSSSPAEARTVLSGGGADLGLFTYQPGIGDNFKLLAQTGDEPISGFEDVPTTVELGHGNIGGSYRGYGTSPNVPQEHIEWLNELFRRVHEHPDFAEQMEGFELVFREPDDVRDLQSQIREAFVPIMDEAGLAHRGLDE